MFQKNINFRRERKSIDDKERAIIEFINENYIEYIIEQLVKENFNSRQINTMNHNYLRMSEEIKRKNPVLNSAILTLLDMVNENSEPKGWDGNVYHF